MNLCVYVRVGSDGALERFPNIEAAAAYLNTLKVGRPTRWYGHGFDTQNYHGSDDIGIFRADEKRRHGEPLGTADRLYLDAELYEVEL